MIDPANATELLASGEQESAYAIAPRLLLRGRAMNKRTIQEWFTKGLPHVVELRRGQETRLTTVAAVIAYAASIGESITAGTPKPAAEARPLFEGAESELERLVRERLEDLVGDPDYDQRIADFRTIFAELSKRLSTGGAMDAGETKLAAETIQRVSAELRQLEEANRNYREKRGELLEASGVYRTYDDLLNVVAAARDGAAVCISKAVADAVVAALPNVPGASDLAARAAQAAAERAVAQVFDTIADTIEQSASALANAGQRAA